MKLRTNETWANNKEKKRVKKTPSSEKFRFNFFRLIRLFSQYFFFFLPFNSDFFFFTFFSSMDRSASCSTKQFFSQKKKLCSVQVLASFFLFTCTNQSIFLGSFLHSLKSHRISSFFFSFAWKVWNVQNYNVSKSLVLCEGIQNTKV